MKILSNLITFTILLCMCSTVHAQYTDVINSNRPGASQSAFSVGTKVLQFEVGPYMIKENEVSIQSMKSLDMGLILQPIMVFGKKL